MRKRKLVDFIDDEVDLSSDDSDYLDEQLQIINSNDVYFSNYK